MQLEGPHGNQPWSPPWGAKGTHPPSLIIIPDTPASFLSFFPLSRIILLFISFRELMGHRLRPGPGWPQRWNSPAPPSGAHSQRGEVKPAQASTTGSGAWEPPNPARRTRSGSREAGQLSGGLNQGQAGFHQCGVRVGWQEGGGVQADETCVKSRSKRKPGTFEEVQVIGSGHGRRGR